MSKVRVVGFLFRGAGRGGAGGGGGESDCRNAFFLKVAWGVGFPCLVSLKALPPQPSINPGFPHRWGPDTGLVWGSFGPRGNILSMKAG